MQWTKRMTKRAFITALVLCAVFSFLAVKHMRAQVHVADASYDMMLSTLLSHTVPEISVADAAADSNIVFLDARAEGEFHVSHINNAIWVGYDDFQLARVSGIAKDASIIVYCSVGYRSEKITEKLLGAGFGNVSNLYGGIFEWVNNDLPVVDASGNETLKVHAYSKSWGIWLKKGVRVYE